MHDCSNNLRQEIALDSSTNNDRQQLDRAVETLFTSHYINSVKQSSRWIRRLLRNFYIWFKKTERYLIQYRNVNTNGV